MFAIILTLSADFLATLRALALELPQMPICLEPVQELTFRPEVPEAEVRHVMQGYITSGRYDKVKLVRR